jgi:hypothetical protein
LYYNDLKNFLYGFKVIARWKEFDGYKDISKPSIAVQVDTGTEVRPYVQKRE